VITLVLFKLYEMALKMFCITSSWTIDNKVNWMVDDIGITGQLIQWSLLDNW